MELQGVVSTSDILTSAPSPTAPAPAPAATPTPSSRRQSCQWEFLGTSKTAPLPSKASNIKDTFLALFDIARGGGSKLLITVWEQGQKEGRRLTEKNYRTFTLQNITKIAGRMSIPSRSSTATPPQLSVEEDTLVSSATAQTTTRSLGEVFEELLKLPTCVSLDKRVLAVWAAQIVFYNTPMPTREIPEIPPEVCRVVRALSSSNDEERSEGAAPRIKYRKLSVPEDVLPVIYEHITQYLKRKTVITTPYLQQHPSDAREPQMHDEEDN